MDRDHDTVFSFPTWPTLTRSLHRIGRSPVTLYGVLLLLNVLTRPYMGIVHDARFYAVQVLSRMDPLRYGGDLYLRFGSQDNFSVFSDLVTPIAVCCGISTAFFLLYLLTLALFLAALQRFVQALIPDRIASTLALIYLAVNPIPFAGLRIFHVNESFLTPRLMAITLVLFGLERLVRGASLVSLACMVAGMLVHPLMAVSGLAVWLLWQLQVRCSPRTVIVFVAGAMVMTVAILSYAPLAGNLFGLMDDTWRQNATQTNPYGVPARWDWADWIRLAVASGVAISWIRSVSDSSLRPLLRAVLFVGLSGTLVGCAAPYLPYALLFQGQAYRAAWILQLVCVPWIFAFACDTVRKPAVSGGIWNSVLLIGFAATSMTVWQIFAFMVFLAAAFSWLHATHAATRSAGLACRLAAVLGVAPALIPTLVSVLLACRALANHCGPHRCLLAIPQTMGPWFTWIAALGIVILLGHRIASNRSLSTISLTIFVTVQTVFFALPFSSAARAGKWQTAKDVDFVQRFLQQDDAWTREGATLYWPLAPLEEVWVTLQSRSYYSLPQMSGNMFYRDTAIEGQRRARIAGRFELDARQPMLSHMTVTQRHVLYDLFDAETDHRELTWQDVRRLSHDPELDLLVLPHAFEGKYAATNGHIYLYDCRALRTDGELLPVSQRNASSSP